MNLILFFIILMTSFIAVRVGAIAFQLTGLEWSLAKFQALSCFTGTGFTTKEAELITGHPQRRRIASMLIVLGHAGFVTLIATFVNSLRPGNVMIKFTLPFLDLAVPPNLVTLINLAIIIAFVLLFYKIFSHTEIGNRITDFLRAHIVKKGIAKRVTFEELVIATGGHGVSQIEICEDSPILNKSILESNLKRLDILILVVERKGITIPNPSADTRILLGDRLICFGKLGQIRKKLCKVF